MAGVFSSDQPRRRRKRASTSVVVESYTDDELSAWLRKKFRTGLVGIARNEPTDPRLKGGARYTLHFDAPLDQVELELEGGIRVPYPLYILQQNFLVLVAGRK